MNKSVKFCRNFAKTLFERSEMYPARVALDGSAIDFARIREQDHCSLRGFLAKTYRVPLDGLLQLYRAAAPAPRPARFIFNEGYCGSTFLAKCVDRMEGSFTVKEPRVLDGWAERYRRMRQGEEMTHWHNTLQMLVALLSRANDPAHRAVVKGGEYTNGIMGELFAIRPDARGILLYTDLPEFLANTLKSDWRRKEFRRVLRVRLASLGPDELELPDVDPETVTDAQAIAYVWVSQLQLAHQAVDRTGSHGLRALNFDRFLEDPFRGLRGVRDHLGLPASDADLCEIATGDLFVFHSKDEARGERPSRYDCASRRAELACQQHRYATEINDGLNWAMDLCGGLIPSLASMDLLQGL